MSIQAFRKALYQRPLSQEERDALTTDELFVLVLARRLDRLTDAEQETLNAADRQYLASAGLISDGSVQMEASSTRAAGPTQPGGNIVTEIWPRIQDSLSR